MFDECCAAALHLLRRSSHRLTENEHTLLGRLESGTPAEVVALLREEKDLEAFRTYVLLTDPTELVTWWKSEVETQEEREVELLLKVFKVRICLESYSTTGYNSFSFGDGYGYGTGQGSGTGQGNRSGPGISTITGGGYGDGFRFGDGNGDGNGNGYGSRFGGGYGNGSSSGARPYIT